MRGRLTKTACAAVAAGALAIGIPVAAASGHSNHQAGDGGGHHHQHTAIKHVLLLSVDGLHQSDLDWYVANHPNSTLAELAKGGREYTDDHTADPSDSDPGGTALVTGGDPKVTGIYYDDEYSHGVFPAGTTNCSGPVRAAT
jgi:hypothetical protein